MLKPGLSISEIDVIPAQAGIRMIKNFPLMWVRIMVLSASRCVFYDWIPACTGMTG